MSKSDHGQKLTNVVGADWKTVNVILNKKTNNNSDGDQVITISSDKCQKWLMVRLQINDWLMVVEQVK